MVKKSTFSKYQLVNVVVELNKVIVRDANLLFLVNKLLEKFAGYVISSFNNFFFSYDQVKLDEKSKDGTGFMTSLSLMRMTILPQGATNSVT